MALVLAPPTGDAHASWRWTAVAVGSLAVLAEAGWTLGARLPRIWLRLFGTRAHGVGTDVVSADFYSSGMATFRSSYSLRLMVEEARKLTEYAAVHERIDAALSIIGDGFGGTYGKGRPLVDALEDVAQACFLHEELELAQRFQRFAGYAGGKLFLNTIENYYDAEARQRSEEFMRRMAALGADRAVSALEALRAENPAASVTDALALFRGIARSTGHLGIGDNEGGIRLPAKYLKRLEEFGHMELILRDLPRPASAETARMLSEFLEDADAGILAQLLELRARRAGLASLRDAVNCPESSESALHACLKNQEWIFGGVFVAELARRQYTPDTILDIPLLRGDGSLHVVELKRANIDKLVIRPSGQLMLGAPVHHAVSQTQNYLRTLDERRDAILSQYGVDTRRASATVVIGHPQYANEKIHPDQIADTLRTYNTHMSRIEVITYETLLESAERMLALSSAERNSGQPEGHTP
ncbi:MULTISPECIES: Shedu anti-phage system protein SduA domain-containing protein [unclassified Streptomyces]|uniref:Shedu anti-phage system protein SduA domain-containing protein n=1 Tax=unclassified Streptomyces TaxID=2593676 RepID=UPI00278C7BB3|nr:MULTISPECIES: Shedu anti-phage system protein SduA domain-containing protein [unclassified Streptomyces]